MKRFGMVVLMGLVLGTNVQAQTKTEAIRGTAVPAVNDVVGVSYTRAINMEVNDTTYQVHVSFTQGEYRYGTLEFVTIGFYNQEALNQFINDLQNAHQHMTSGEKPRLSWKRDRYNLDLFTGWAADALIISDARGRGASVKTKNVAKLIEFLSTIQFGK
jgi:hypothetical protein